MVVEVEVVVGEDHVKGWNLIGEAEKVSVGWCVWDGGFWADRA